MSLITDAWDRTTHLADSLFNLVTGLGTAKDPRRSTHFYYNELDRNILEQMYRSDWLARRLVDLPAEDATREWRSWTGDAKVLEKIDHLERKLELQKKVRMALIRARLYGGGALVMGVDQGQPEEELDFDKVGLGDLKFVVVCNRYELAAGPRIYNVDSPWYTRPEYYTVATPMFGFFGEPGGAYPSNAKQAGAPLLPDKNRSVNEPNYGMVRVHPSRIIEFAGNELPDWRLAPMGGGWGDSILQTVEDSLKDFSMIMGGLASMINDMKMDVVKIPELSRKLSTADLTQKTLQRFGLANMAKSSINTLLLDKDEDWERITTSFGSTPELIKTAMTVACAAGGVPESRIMGNAPSRGLAGTGKSGGEVDIRNYYDDIASQQKSKYKPMLLPLDVCVQRSATGKFDPNVDYSWNPLYQPTTAEKAQEALVKAQTTQVYVTAGLINEDALREAVVSQLVEDEIYPGLEDAIDEFGAEPEEPPAPQMPVPPTPPPGFVPKGQFDPNPFHMLRAQQAAKAGQPIRVPPNRPAAPPKFMPAPPGSQSVMKAKDYSPDQPRDETGKWSSGGAAAAGAEGEGEGDPSVIPHMGVAETSAAYGVASKAAHAFVTSQPVQRGIAHVVANVALSTTASVAHETTMHLLHKGVETALDSAIGLVGAHLLGHAGLVAAGGTASAIAPVAIAVVAGLAVHKLSEHAGISEHNAKKVLAATGRFLIDHFHALYHAGESAPMAGMVDAEAEDPLVLQALKLLVPHWETGE